MCFDVIHIKLITMMKDDTEEMIVSSKSRCDYDDFITTINTFEIGWTDILRWTQ